MTTPASNPPNFFDRSLPPAVGFNLGDTNPSDRTLNVYPSDQIVTPSNRPPSSASHLTDPTHGNPLEIEQGSANAEPHLTPVAERSLHRWKIGGIALLETAIVLDCILAIHNALFWIQLAEQEGCQRTQINLPNFGKPNQLFICPDECFPTVDDSCPLLGQSLAGVTMTPSAVQAFYAKYSDGDLLLTDQDDHKTVRFVQVILASLTIAGLARSTYKGNQQATPDIKRALAVSVGFTIACLLATKALSAQPMQESSGFYPSGVIKLGKSINFFYLGLTALSLSIGCLSCLCHCLTEAIGLSRPPREQQQQENESP